MSCVVFQRYPVMWQGHLALKNDSSSVQMHFVAGSKSLVTNSLSQFGTDSEGTPLRIAQRMRLEPTQLDGVSRRMQVCNAMNKRVITVECQLLQPPSKLDDRDLNSKATLLRGLICYTLYCDRSNLRLMQGDLNCQMAVFQR